MKTPIESLERFDFGGPAQWALVRGQDSSLPVLLLVQQGPGFPMIQDADALERTLHLEEHFRVVYWDQRGTGKSFSAKDTAPLELGTVTGDVRKMVHALCERLHVSKIDVAAFSVGSSLALLAAAEEPLPIRSLVCAAPDANMLESEKFALAFALAEAQRRGNSGALKALKAIGPAPHMDTKRFMKRVQWVSNFGGIHRGKTFFGILRTTLGRLWSSKYYSLLEMVRALAGMETTQRRLLPALGGIDLLTRPMNIGVPVAVFQGRHDAGAVPKLAQELAGKLGAKLVWFENSAHMPQEEEPRRFREELLRFVESRGQA